VNSDGALAKLTVVRDLVTAGPFVRFNSRLVVVLSSSRQRELRLFIQKTAHSYISVQSIHKDLQQA
jgi:hypothetical protein